MIDMISRAHCVCISGHRPEKLKRPAQCICADLECKILESFVNGAEVFFSGMARGVDLWAAQIVLKLRNNGLPIQLVCVCPYRGVEKRWEKSWQTIFDEILKQADSVVYICDQYRKGCFQIRNEWMVDHAAKVIAVWSGKRSGTQNTVEYAIKNGILVTYIEA